MTTAQALLALVGGSRDHVVQPADVLLTEQEVTATMISYGKGDLLQADTEALINTVNCVGVMGKGIALQYKRRYPDMFAAYQKVCKRGEVAIGKMFVYETGQLEGPKYIINFPTKKHWRSPSQLSYIDDGLIDLIRVIRDLNITSIAVPPLGAGNGGLDWSDVEPRLVKAFSQIPDVNAVLYAPARRPPERRGDQNSHDLAGGRLDEGTTSL